MYDSTNCVLVVERRESCSHCQVQNRYYSAVYVLSFMKCTIVGKVKGTRFMYDSTDFVPSA